MGGAFDLAAAFAERTGGIATDAGCASSSPDDVVVGDVDAIAEHLGRALFAVVEGEACDPPEGWATWFHGSVRQDGQRVRVGVWSRHGPPRELIGSTSGRCLAIIAAYNEVDVLEAVVRRLVEQGVEVYLIDNWSDDGTYDLGVDLRTRGLLAGLEHFPGTPQRYSNWAALLERKAAVAVEQGALWAIHNDADEVRTSPWPDLNLREGLAVVDRLGFSAVDFTVVEHPPIAAPSSAAGDVIDAMPWYRFGRRAGHFVQIKAWRAPGVVVRMGAGHNVEFPGRKVFPCNFVVHHYPVRSTEHGRRKALVERKDRFDPGERERGWHRHYEHVTDETEFIEDRARLDLFDPVDFASDRMGEMVARVGLDPEP